MIPAKELEACRWIVTGRVQGVGFRPFVFSLAKRFGLAGRVQNLAGQVLIEAEGAEILVGNIVGADILNVLFVVGASAVVLDEENQRHQHEFRRGRNDVENQVIQDRADALRAALHIAREGACFALQVVTQGEVMKLPE